MLAIISMFNKCYTHVKIISKHLLIIEMKEIGKNIIIKISAARRILGYYAILNNLVLNFL